MKLLSFADIAAMKGNGSSMRTVLKNFIDRGATVYLLHETLGEATERFFVVEYEGLRIPLRAYKLNFYCVLNSALGQKITSYKHYTNTFLELNSLPTPETIEYGSHQTAADFLTQHAAVVVKPRNGAHGDGITTNITTQETLVRAIEHARSIDDNVLVQQQVSGEDYRLLFINFRFVAAVRREPASILGDGQHSVRELVEAANAQKTELWQNIRNGSASADETRGSISKTPLEEIVATHGAEFLDHVPASQEKVQLTNKANVSLGGQTVDVTDKVNTELASAIGAMLKQLDLRICGVDVLSSDISSAPQDAQSFIIELNSAPGLRLHELPAIGTPRPVCATIVDALIEHYRSIADN